MLVAGGYLYPALVQSLVDPSREIAPQFTSWTIRTVDGQVKTGLHVGDEIDGRIRRLLALAPVVGACFVGCAPAAALGQH